MSRLQPLSREDLAEFEPMFELVEQTMGFLPNSVLTMAHKPGLLPAAMALFQAVQGPGSVEPGLKSMLAHMTSYAAGCRYCQAHTGHTAARLGIPAEKIESLWDFEDSALFSEAEKAALRIALGAGQVPNAVTDQDFEALKTHFDAEQIAEIVAVIAMFGFLNRWNDTMATELESSPLRFGEAHLAPRGWSADKHGT